MSESVIDPNTFQGYREAEYKVFATPAFALCIGQASDALADLHGHRMVSHSAFITACNPFSRVLDTEENTTRHSELGREQARLEVPYVEGIRQRPSNLRPEVPS